MNSIVINRINYSGDKYYYNSPKFDKGVNLITGYNNVGKSTLMNLIYFSLGGTFKPFYEEYSAQERVITEDTNNYVEIFISINDVEYKLLRKFKSKERNYITIYDVDDIKVLYLDRRSNSFIFSDWMLNKLSIPSFKVSSGAIDFVFGFNDMFRLIYHDQLSDKDYIYKTPDGKSNYVNDSMSIRKTIFEVLTNNSSVEYYEKANDIKGKMAEISTQEKVSLSLENAVKKISKTSTVRNSSHIKVELSRLNNKIRLEEMQLNDFGKLEKISKTTEDKINQIRSSIIQLNNEILIDKKNQDANNNEISEFIKLHGYQIDEIKIIQTIINTQEELHIIDSNKCPICGEPLDSREINHCICGAELDESKYLDFFYSLKDHKVILTTKMKEISTTEKAIDILRESSKVYAQKIEDNSNKLENLKGDLGRLLISASNNSQLENAKFLIESIKSSNLLITKLSKELEFSNELEEQYNTIRKLNEELRELKVEYEALGLQVKENMNLIIRNFSKIYNDFLVSTEAEIHAAGIDDDYLPTINNLDYINAATRVPRRLYYYLSLLKLSILYDIPSPRMLLIDTPKNFGIDDDKMMEIMREVNKFNNDHLIDNGQILLTISPDSVPKEMNGYIKIEIDENKLLVKREKEQEEQEEH